MLTPELYAEARKQGVALEELAELLRPLAAAHFGPELRMECNVEEDRLVLFAALWIKADSGPGAIALEQVNAKFGEGTFQLDDELVVQVFVAPGDRAAAISQDEEYLAVTGISSVGCGFFPVVRHAIETRLGFEVPGRVARQRVLTCAIEPDPRFVLRRNFDFELELKELVEVRAGGELEPHAKGRRDLVAGSVVEVVRRAVSAEELLAGLANPELATRLGAIEPAHVEWVVKHLRSPNVVKAHVPYETEGRFIP